MASAAALPVVSVSVRPDSCSSLVKRRSPLTPTSHNGTSLTIGSLALTLCTPFTSSNSPGATRSPSPRASAPSNWSLALGMILRLMACPSRAWPLRYCSKARNRWYSTPMAWPCTSPELLRLWLTNTRRVRLERICARSRTLPGLATCSGPSRRATAAMGSSNVRHNISNAEGRIIRSPKRKLASTFANNDVLVVRNRALYALARRATAPRW